MFTRTLAEPPPADDLYSALRQMLHSPLRTIVPPWSWKAATFSAVLRAATFFWSNLSSGREEAFRAMLLEAAYAVFAAGLVGAVSQRLRGSRPVWITCVIVWLCLPGIMVALQLVLHRLAHTPHVGVGIATSFCFSAITSAFSWYAMRHGIMLGGAESTTFKHDLLGLPVVTLNFLLSVPRAIWRTLPSR